MTEGERQYVVVKFLLRDRTANRAVCGIATDSRTQRAGEKTARLKPDATDALPVQPGARARDEEYELLRSVCRIPGRRSVAFGWHGSDTANSTKTNVRPVAQADTRPGTGRNQYYWGDNRPRTRTDGHRHPDRHHILEQGHSDRSEYGSVANRGAQARLRVYHFLP